MEFLVLEVDGARFGIPTSDVHEVVRAASLGAAPARFANMTGILNYRGQVLGVWELTFLRGRAERTLTPNEHFIILAAGEQRFALRVDQAVEIMTWSDDDPPARQSEATSDLPAAATRAIAHPELGVVYLLETNLLWSELHGHAQPTQEVEAN